MRDNLKHYGMTIAEIATCVGLMLLLRLASRELSVVADFSAQHPQIHSTGMFVIAFLLSEFLFRRARKWHLARRTAQG